MLRTTKRDTFHLMSVIGSLSIEQFNNDQDEYRKVINSIIIEFYKFNQKDNLAQNCNFMETAI